LSISANGELFMVNSGNGLFRARPDALSSGDDGSAMTWTMLGLSTLKVSADANGDVVTIGTDYSVHRY